LISIEELLQSRFLVVAECGDGAEVHNFNAKGSYSSCNPIDCLAPHLTAVRGRVIQALVGSMPVDSDVHPHVVADESYSGCTELDDSI
jgi:hypothetical protein